MSIYTFPSPAKFEQVEQDLIPVLTLDDPLFRPGGIFPIRNVDDSILIWEQKDNYLGLQAVRGLDGEPPRVERVDSKQYIMKPGVYGEHIAIDEYELTRRRKFGTLDQTVDVTDLVMEAQEQLLTRRYNRIRQIAWSLLTTGSFSVSDLKGSIQHKDSISLRTYNAAVAWATLATATPLADFRAAQLLARGYSVSFGTGATAWMNQGTANALLGNTNAADLYGRRSTGLATLNTMTLVNELLAGDGLPNLMIYDDGYLNSAGTFVNFIPDNKVIIIGKRTSGVAVGEYRMTRNANNPNLAPGAYTKVFDRSQDRVPAAMEVHDGHNGGPCLMLGSSILIMNV